MIGLIVNRLILIILSIFSTSIYAQNFIGKNGTISFYSEAPLENISAINNNVSAVYDSEKKQLVFQLNIRDFIFPKSLMQEHFNENYLESDIYPKASFNGLVVSKDNNSVLVNGDLKIHGKTKSISVEGNLIENASFVKISANFIIILEEYNIKIPTIVMYKIAEEIEVKVNIDLKRIK
tara:strand:+ start:742 stop:1278 length:537 start_codon:yes stop_codon:yes gene_type:complete